jgi:hypothetical protein
MNNKFDSIERALDVKVTEISKESIKDKKDIILKSSNNQENCDVDYEYTRGNLYSLIEKGQELIDNVMELAQQSDSPRAYEVAGQIIKNVADTTDKLIDLQQKMKKLKEEEPKGPKSITNNTMFVGSTAELQKLLKQNVKSTEDSK